MLKPETEVIVIITDRLLKTPFIRWYILWKWKEHLSVNKHN